MRFAYVNMKVLIADDHKLVTEGLELLLSTFDFVQQILSAFDELGVLAALPAQPDVVLLDIALGRDDGREICRKIKKMHPGIKVIALTSHSDSNTVKSAIQAGFDGYLLKAEDRATVQSALIKVAKGDKFFSSKVQEIFFTAQTTAKTELTKREIEVLQLILDEKTTKQIAETLFISEKTAENHRSSIMLKMDVKNMAGLVKKAILMGYVNQ